MRKWLLATTVALQCLAGHAQAQDTPSPETLAAAQELAAIVSQDTIKQLSQTMIAQIWPKLQAELGPKVDQATLMDLRRELEDALTRFVDGAMKDAPAIYARHFTAGELHDIAAFYRSPSGRKALQNMPKVTAESFASIMPRMQGFQRELEGLIAGVLKKHGYPK